MASRAMTPVFIPDPKMIAAMREQGIKRFAQTAEGYEVEFFTPTPTDAPISPEKMPPVTGEQKCDCGCLLSDHEPQGGTCLHGCDAAKCGVEEEEP